MRARLVVSALFGVCVIGLAGCGGGGGASTVPTAPATSAPAGGGAGTASTVAFTIKIPNAGASSSTNSARIRRPQYVSVNTQSASIAVNGGTPTIVNLTPGSPNCTTTGGVTTCTASVAAPIGNDTFAVSLYGQVNAAGPALSQGTVTQTIVAAQTNTVSLTLGGIVASLSIGLSNPTPTAGTAATSAVSIMAKDASGAIIVGSDPFVTPVTVTDSDTSGVTSLSPSPAIATNPSSAITLSYTGGPLTSASIGASSGSIAATPVTFAPQAATTSNFNDYTMFGYDPQHDVYNPNSTSFTTGAIANLHLAWQSLLGGVGDYNVLTQPILATEIPGHAGVLFVGGGTGNIYGYDATSGNLIWTKSAGQEQYTCQNNYTAYFGIGGSAAYDPSTKSVYIAGNTNATPDALATNTLYRLDAATGTVLGSVAFASPAMDTTWNSLDFSHTAVTVSNGIAYVGTGATCDRPAWRGRIVAISVPAMTVLNTFYTVWNGTTQPWSGGGVWGWGGVSVDFSGNVLTGVGNATDSLATNNGNTNPPFLPAPTEYSGFGDSLIKINAAATTELADNQPIPTSVFTGGAVDLDINGTPLIIQPQGVGCDPVAAVQGKAGALYLYDEATFGSTNGPLAQYQLAPSSYNDYFLGEPAYSPATGLIYEAVTTAQNNVIDPPGMIAINPGCGSPSIVWKSTFGPDSYSTGISRSVPAVSAGGVVFVGTTCSSTAAGTCAGSVTSSSATRKTTAARLKPLICCAPAGGSNGAVWAVDAATGAVLNGGNPIIITGAPLRVPPTIDGDWLFVLDGNGDLYGLTLDPSVPTIAEKARANTDARVLKVWGPPSR